MTGARANLLAAIAVAVLAGAAAGPDASADPVDLKIRHAPLPRHLRMRPRTAATPDPAATTPAPTTTTAPTTPPPTTTTTTAASATTPGPITATGPTPIARSVDFDVKGVRRADEQIVFRLDLGFGVDGGAISGRRAVAGEALSSADYREVRAYGFGNLFVGTRGLLIPPLSSYLSMGFRVAPHLSTIAPLADALDSTRDVQIRAGWAEATSFLPGKLLRSVRVRAGRQYAYGPWPIHFDGVVAAWTSKALQVSALAGQRVDDYAPQGEPLSNPPIVSVIAALDLGQLGRWPITVRSTAMWMSGHRFADLELGYRPRRGLVVVGSARRIDDHAARERGTLRAQISDVTHVVIEVEHRRATDWRWDPAYIDPADPGSARPFLELPQVVPQLRAYIRAGTVLVDNIDLYGRAGLAVDLVDRPDERTGYAELGGAFEVRVRRAFAVTGSVMIRDYELTDPQVEGNQQTDIGNVAQPLIDPDNPDQASSLGQESFVEAGLGFRGTTGARRFSASTEAYGRRTRYGFLYEEDSPLIGDLLDRNDLRGGLRFSLDGWLSPRLRLHLEYDLSTTLDHAPEINGWKVLRILAEGSF